jgi:hypothetical protein
MYDNTPVFDEDILQHGSGMAVNYDLSRERILILVKGKQLTIKLSLSNLIISLQ